MEKRIKPSWGNKAKTLLVLRTHNPEVNGDRIWFFKNRYDAKIGAEYVEMMRGPEKNETRVEYIKRIRDGLALHGFKQGEKRSKYRSFEG